MKKFYKILLWLVIEVVTVIVVLIGYIQLGWKKTFDAPYPAITASKDG